MKNIPSEFDITLKNHINITSFKMKGQPDLGEAGYILFFASQVLNSRKNKTINKVSL